jgi:hypothetical protein
LAIKSAIAYQLKQLNMNEPQFSKDRQLRLWIYFLPVVGLLPSCWTLATGKGDRQKQNASRLSITLVLIWLGAYCTLSLGATQASEILAFRLLYTNALLTTGYFLLCIFLLLRLGRGQSPRLSGIDRVANFFKTNNRKIQ